MKVFLDIKQVQRYIDLHKNMKIPFEMTLTNYTTRIKSTFCDKHFMRNSQSKMMFTAYTMLKKDVSTRVKPFVRLDKLTYFDTGFTEEMKIPLVYNFDIKSAYLTCLLVNGMIEKKTFDYLKRLPKMDRLASVGMLAGRRTVFIMDKNGKEVSETTSISPLENFFFYCVNEIGNLMRFAASYMGNAFLFTWVDGIYFKPNELQAAQDYYIIMSEYFKEKGYEVSFEILENFETERFGNDCWKVSYIKEGKPKQFMIPIKVIDLKRRVQNYLLNKNYSEHE